MEPMNLGSPISSPGNNQNQFLPPFLMGDPQAMTPHNNTLSPKQGRYNVSFATSPSVQSSQETLFNNPGHLNRSALGGRTLFVGNTAASSTGDAIDNNTNHQFGPPTQGLFDSLRNDHVASMGTPQRNHLLQSSQMNLNSSVYSLNQSCQPSSQLNDSYMGSGPNAINASMRGLCSPLGANMSPLTIAQTPQPARNLSFWVTIYGFPSGAASMILQHFTVCGNIVDVVNAPQKGNWMHVRYSSRLECDKALNYNQKIIATNVMIGVVRCTDESVLDKENINSGSHETSYKPRIRPLTQENIQSSHSDLAVSPTAKIPQKSTGLMDKAIDYIFGW